MLAATRSARSSSFRSVFVLVSVLLAGLFVLPVSAADDRPTEIPYETPGDIPNLSPDYRRSSHKVVLITDDALSPRTVTLEEGQLVAWISYARSPSTIVFEREVARSMICHSLVNFSIEDDELKSAEIHAGEFASFCQLKPGRYRYKVVKKNPKAGGHDTGPARIEGVIVVGNPPAES